ncbi:RNA-binding region-containing protein 3-like [Uloborus diversus]|uniref:RNA-binding region-containing protein 3-like n=1 Tax=Uloborus diversus TaxID=327109 RepID=UPI0024098297|nr:RNA-binding region-containing protein 3-like [Uloborus diversus]
MEPTTLYVRHLPSELSPADREELLRLVGAVRIRIMPDDRKMKHAAFASFQNHEDARHALSLLHQREILGRRLTVEFAKQQQVPPVGDGPKPVVKEAPGPEPTGKEVLRTDMEAFSKGLHGVAPALGLDYLPSPMLKYKYPPPTATVIRNIGHALASCPKFYTQVLHLMNKMNLPAPFGPPTPAPPLAVEEEVEEVVMEEEEEESEYESEPERREEREAVRERPPARPKPKRKRRRLADLVPVVVPASSREKTEPSEVFESRPLSQKKISMKIDPTALADHNQKIPKPEEEPAGGFGAFGGAPPSGDDPSEQRAAAEEDDWHDGRFISLEELRRKRLSSREMRTMSVFRNYSPGEPTLRLYIKNLAKQVVEKDLRHIFGRFVDADSEREREMFDVKLMKEGRMKGQAFVTLASEGRAAEAVRETNGFVLHTKPLVVHFARSAKPKDGK